MNTTTPTAGVTARALLFGDTDLVSSLEKTGVATTLSEELDGFARTTREEAIRQVGKVTSDLLDLDLTQLVLNAWSTHAELKAAGERTLRSPDSEELVDLVSHEVTFDDQPSIDLLVNGQQIDTVHLTLSLTVDIDALTAIVKGGRLIGVRVGRCRVDGRLSIEDKCVADRRAELQLPFSLRLGSGLSLATGREAASPQSPRWGGRK